MKKEPIELNINLEGKEYSLNYMEELKCSEDTINEDLKDQPALFAWYAVLQELAEAAYQEAKAALDMIVANLDAEIRQELLKKGKFTETMVRNAIILHKDYQEANKHVIEIKKTLGLIKGIKEAFYHRKDMLVSLASNMRVAADPELFVKKQLYSQKV